MKKALIVLMVIALIAVGAAAACGGGDGGGGGTDGKPTEADCRQVVENLIREEDLAQEITIVSFELTDSYTVMFMGTEFYVVEFDIEIRYLDDVEDERVSLSVISSVVVSGAIRVSGTKGTTQRFEKPMEFFKTDKGWKGQDHNYY